MKRKYLFPTLIVALLAGCSTTPGETNDSSSSQDSGSSEFSESMHSVSSEISSFESEESSSGQSSPAEKDSSSFTWESAEEAINYFEQTYKNPQNAIQEEVILENYDRSDWKLEDIGNNQVVLRWLNPDNAEDRYYFEMSRVDGFTQLYVYQGELEVYEGDIVYPATPFKQYTVRDDDFTVVDSKNE